MLNLYLKSLLTISLVFIVNNSSMALTGEDISYEVDRWLLKEGVKGQAVFSKNAVFKDCKNDLIISKLFKDYKTIRVRLLDEVRSLKNNQTIVKKIQKDNKSTLRTKVKKFFKIVKLNKTLEKKSILKVEDLDIISSNKPNQASFFNNKNQLIGRKLKKNLKMGQLLHPRHLYEKFESERGDLLSIVSSIGQASVTVSGEAQNSGNLGDLISVKNLRSGKIIKGYIKKNKIIKVFR